MKQVQNQDQQQPLKANSTPIKVTPCPWCLVNSGRTHGERKCCQLRRLALAPRHAQAEYAKTLTDEERNDLRPRLVAEIKRLKDLENEKSR